MTVGQVYLPQILDRFEETVGNLLIDSLQKEEERNKDIETARRAKESISTYLELKRRNGVTIPEEIHAQFKELDTEVRRIEKKWGIIRSEEEEEVYQDKMSELLQKSKEELNTLLIRFQMYMEAKEVGGNAFSLFLDEVGFERYGQVYNYIDLTSEFARNVNRILIRDLETLPNEVYHTEVGKVTNRIWKACEEFLNELREEKERYRKEESK